MEPITQKIFAAALVALIKGVALTGVVADVSLFFVNKYAVRVTGFVKKKAGYVRSLSSPQLTKQGNC